MDQSEILTTDLDNFLSIDDSPIDVVSKNLDGEIVSLNFRKEEVWGSRYGYSITFYPKDHKIKNPSGIMEEHFHLKHKDGNVEYKMSLNGEVIEKIRGSVDKNIMKKIKEFCITHNQNLIDCWNENQK